MQNATRELLRASLTVAALATGLLCAELSTPPAPAHSGDATAKGDSILRVRSISIDHNATPSLSHATPAREQRSVLALAK